MKKLIAMVTLMMVALCAMTLTAVAETVISSAALEACAKVEIVVEKAAEEDGETGIAIEITEEETETAEATAMEMIDFDALPVITGDAEESEAQEEAALEEELLEIGENDIEGLEIIIIENLELDAQDEAEACVVLVEEDEEEGELVILEDEEAEELTMEDGAVPLAGPAMVAIDRQVNVRTNLGACVNENETVTLTGELVGFEGCDVQVQWQVLNGTEWENIEGATGMEYSFAATSDSVNSSYRLAVAING